MSSQYKPAKIKKVRQIEVDEDLGKALSSGKLAKALWKLKNGKAPGSSDIFPEIEGGMKE